MSNKGSVKKMMSGGVLLLAILGFSSVQGAVRGNLVPVDIKPEGQVAVKLGQNLTIMCTSAVPLQVCRYTIPGEGSLLLKEGQYSDDGISYAGEGLKHGQCGVFFRAIRDVHDGNVTCSLTPEGGRTESFQTVKLVVAKPPSHPELYVSSGSGGRYMFRKGEKMDVSCIASGGRPAANVSLFLDDEPLIIDDRPYYAPAYYGQPVVDENTAMKNASRSVDPSDNGKLLRCVANHIALEQPLESTHEITVFYSPVPEDEINKFGYIIGRPGKVNVTIRANPRPNFVWKVNEERIYEGKTDESNRLEADSAVNLGKGLWSVSLTIDSVQKSDTEKNYVLQASNEEGSYEYKIRLSTSAEPAGMDLDAGSIIGIVVGVLLLIVAVFIALFARATGRWCFAADSEKRAGGEADVPGQPESVNLLHVQKSNTEDTSPRRSDTESTGRFSRTEVDTGKSRLPKISLSQLFRRNKDKVSGTDTDTVRTVVTMEDEKVPPTDTETPASGEGGIVYAELDLVHQQQGVKPRVKDEKTEYAEILYTKPEEQNMPGK